jgi:hypothetical protein
MKSGGQFKPSARRVKMFGHPAKLPVQNQDNVASLPNGGL